MRRGERAAGVRGLWRRAAAHLVRSLGGLRVSCQQRCHHRLRRLVLRGNVQRQLPTLCTSRWEVSSEQWCGAISPSRAAEVRARSAAGARCLQSQPLADEPSTASLPPLPMLGRPRRSAAEASHPVRGRQEGVCDDMFKCMVEHEATYGIFRLCAVYQQQLDHFL